MKKVESFEHRTGWGGIEETDNEVNEKLKKLNSKGINNIEILSTSTGKGLVYTVIWDEEDKNNEGINQELMQRRISNVR